MVQFFYIFTKYNQKLLGIEVQEHRYLQALKNIKLNNLEYQIEVLNQDIKTLKLKKEADIIVSNPPFLK